MSDAAPRGVLVFGGSPARRTEVGRTLRADGAFTPVRVASQMAEAMKCLADGAVHSVVVLDDRAAALQLREHVDRMNAATAVFAVASVAELEQALHDIISRKENAIDRL